MRPGSCLPSSHARNGEQAYSQKKGPETLQGHFSGDPAGPPGETFDRTGRGRGTKDIATPPAPGKPSGPGDTNFSTRPGRSPEEVHAEPLEMHPDRDGNEAFKAIHRMYAPWFSTGKYW